LTSWPHQSKPSVMSRPATTAAATIQNDAECLRREACSDLFEMLAKLGEAQGNLKTPGDLADINRIREEIRKAADIVLERGEYARGS
jgi:hypothetical protein